MEVQEAIGKTKDYIKLLFAEEGVSNLALEELEYHDALKQWDITFGFSRYWNSPSEGGTVQSATGMSSVAMEKFFAGMIVTPKTERTYKVITISKEGKILKMKDRFLEKISE